MISTVAALALGATFGGSEPCDAPFRFDNKDSLLQRNLTSHLERAGLGRYIGKESLAVAVVDLSQRGKRYYAGINDRNMMYAASLPKIAILLAVLEWVNEGRIPWSGELDRRLQSMILDSSNGDASWAFDQVGQTGIEAAVRDPRYCLYDNEQGGLWVGRAYRGGSDVKRDPLKDISHGATARQAARFYAMLDAGYLVSRHWSFRMLGLMGPPTQVHKFVGALADRSGVVFLARKSGTWRNFHSDSALIHHHDARYVVVALTETRHGEPILREVARIVDDLMVEGAHRTGLRTQVMR